jgi:hypothetical protein
LREDVTLTRFAGFAGLYGFGDGVHFKSMSNDWQRKSHDSTGSL